MAYKAENIDTDKFLEHIRFLEDYDRTNEYREKSNVEKYHEGYRKALNTIKDMFYCCNYEKREREDKQ